LSKIDFQREIKAFRKMPAVPHLVELCATFESDRVYRLLFPWANGGSLKRLWTDNNLPTALFCKQEDIDPPVFVHWLATQAHGLMSGLKTIHKLPEPGPGEVVDGKRYGIHGDLKPENILHFSQETERHQFGTLKIADFGIVEFHSLATRTSLNQEWSGPASPTYRAPEHDWDIEEKMSRKVDIWSMGCVFSEMLTWALLGGDAVELYREARLKDETRLGGPDPWFEDSFFCRTKGDAQEQYDTGMVKPSVSQVRITHAVLLRSS
jgi:serine/threonine protein kinase